MQYRIHGWKETPAGSYFSRLIDCDSEAQARDIFTGFTLAIAVRCSKWQVELIDQATQSVIASDSDGVTSFVRPSASPFVK